MAAPPYWVQFPIVDTNSLELQLTDLCDCCGHAADRHVYSEKTQVMCVCAACPCQQQLAEIAWRRPKWLREWHEPNTHPKAPRA